MCAWRDFWGQAEVRLDGARTRPHINVTTPSGTTATSPLVLRWSLGCSTLESIPVHQVEWISLGGTGHTTTVRASAADSTYDDIARCYPASRARASLLRLRPSAWTTWLRCLASTFRSYSTQYVIRNTYLFSLVSDGHGLTSRAPSFILQNESGRACCEHPGRGRH